MDPALAIAVGAVFGQVFLVGLIYVRLLVLRMHAVRSGEVRFKDIALSTAAYSMPIQMTQNNLANQFELPVLFYVCVALAVATGAASPVLATCAVIFVVLRYWHAAIHMGANNMRRRFMVFAAGSLAVLGCWLALGIALLA